jgi:hypothetical protein
MTTMRKFTRDVAEGLEAVFGPVMAPRWLHNTVWTFIWVIWIAGAVGFVYERLV